MPGRGCNREKLLRNCFQPHLGQLGRLVFHEDRGDDTLGVDHDPAGYIAQTAAAATSAASAATTTRAGADEAVVSLSIGKTGPSIVGPGDPITYTLSVTNSGAHAATGVVPR